MKVYAYYELIKDFDTHKNQKLLLSLWKSSWEKAGFEAIILNQSDILLADTAFKKAYRDFVQEVHLKATGKALDESGYHMSTHNKLLAYSTIKEPSFYSDWDLINISFKASEVEQIPQQVCWRDHICTCFCSGGSNGMRTYFDFLFSEKETIINFCSSVIQDKNNRARFHDQDFLEAIYFKGLDENIFVTEDKKIVGFPNLNSTESESPLIHVANFAVAKRIKHDTDMFDYQVPGYLRQQLRTQIAQEILGIISYKKFNYQKI